MTQFYPYDQFFSKDKTSDPRLGDCATSLKEILPAEDLSFCVVGYPDDEGAAMNGGRRGAAEAPARIRDFLYRLTPPFKGHSTPVIGDRGDLVVLDGNQSLPQKAKHEAAQKNILEILKNKHKCISLGGSHDYGFPDAAGFLDFCQHSSLEKPLVINFDAHLDVRPLDKGLTSGTPFYRLLSDYKDFDFLEIGMQNHCNSAQHYQWLTQHSHAAVIDMTDIEQARPAGLKQLLQTQYKSWITKDRPCFLSVDIDVFSSTVAPGCSQSWPTGLEGTDFFEAYRFLLQTLNVLGVGIYEVAPAFDHDNQTSKLAALIAYDFIYNFPQEF